MRVNIVGFLLFLVMLSVVEASAQKFFLREESNRFMSLDIKKPGTIKRIKFYENDKIILKVKTYRGRFKGTITNLTDTTLTLDNATVVFYKDIEKVLLDQSNSVTKVASNFLKVAGGGYIALDIVNNLITSTSPIINPRTIVIGAVLIVTGQLVKWLCMRHYKIDKNHRIKYIDDTP
jgi:hypothetical protein